MVELSAFIMNESAKCMYCGFWYMLICARIIFSFVLLFEGLFFSSYVHVTTPSFVCVLLVAFVRASGEL